MVYLNDLSARATALLRRYVWLPLAFAFFALCSSRFPVPAAYAAGLACCLRYARANRPWHLAPLFVASLGGFWISSHGTTGFSERGQFVVALLITIVVYAPVVVDRVLMGAGLRGGAQIISFALLVASFSHLATLLSPFGVIGIPGTEFLWRSSLAQLVCVTGVIGGYFINGWTAALVSAALLTKIGSHTFRGDVVKKNFAWWAATMFCLYLFSGMAYVFAPINGAESPQYVTVGGVIVPGPEGYALPQWMDKVYGATDAAAAAGARVIAWSEWGVRVDTYAGDKLDYAACDSGLCDLLARVRAIAMRRGAYVLPSFITDEYAAPGGPAVAGNKLLRTENNAFMVGPDGEVLFRYSKVHLVMGWEDDIEAGRDFIPTVDTPYGRIGAVICMDMVFPQYLAQAGRKNVDILLGPSEDWPDVYKFASYTFTLRAPENGMTVVRVDNLGRSLIVDPYGNVLFEDNFYAHEDAESACGMPDNRTCRKAPYFFTKAVPGKAHRATLYPWLFDVHAYVVYTIAVFLAVLAWINYRYRDMLDSRPPILVSMFRSEWEESDIETDFQPLVA
eukprot:m51a1_g1860 hypothetical protein (563) ;mRNA; f:625904-628297